MPNASLIEDVEIRDAREGVAEPEPRVEVEEADELLRYALDQARANYHREVGTIIQMAARREHKSGAQGWQFDLDHYRWYRQR